jgi:hypothetical protein
MGVFLVLTGDEPDKQTKALQTELGIKPVNVEKLSADLSALLVGDEPKAPEKAAEAARSAMDKREEALIANLARMWSRAQDARFEELSCQFAGPMALRLKHYTQTRGSI